MPHGAPNSIELEHEVLLLGLDGVGKSAARPKFMCCRIEAVES